MRWDVTLEDEVGPTGRPRWAEGETGRAASHLSGDLEVEAERLSLVNLSFLHVFSLALREMIHLAGTILVLFGKEECHSVIKTETNSDETSGSYLLGDLIRMACNSW